VRGLVDTMLAHRKLFILHQRNQTALSGLHIKGHDGLREAISDLLEPRGDVSRADRADGR
jgi:hypothetical protein